MVKENLFGKDGVPLDRITPEDITELKTYEIFVFGSNLSGIHGGGAARQALDNFGAIYGQFKGIQGNSYAIPTKTEFFRDALPIEELKKYVNEFIIFAKMKPTLKFLVTEIGCGLAGYSVLDIAPLFKDCINLNNVSLPERFWSVLIN